MLYKRVLAFFPLICLVISTFVPVKTVQGAYSYPVEASRYLQAGETIQALHPVIINGKQYAIVYYQTKTNTDLEGGILYGKTPTQVQSQGITGILVFDGCSPVSDADVIKQVLITEISGYMSTQISYIPEMVTASNGLKDQMDSLRTNPLFWTAFLFQNIAQWFKTPEEEYIEAFRNMLVPQGAEATLLKGFADDTQELIKTGESIPNAIEKTYSVAKYSNDRSIREFAKGADKYFNGWDIVTASQKVKIDGVDVEYFNALKIFSLAFTLYGMQNLSRERADMLDRFAQAAENGEISVDQVVLSAIHAVVGEARDADKQSIDVVAQFIRDNAVDVGISATEKVLAKKWATYAFKKWGTRTVGHFWAGAASQVLLGFEIANLLYGMNEVYASSITGKRAADLEKVFNDAAVSVKNNYSTRAYDYQYADIFRTGVFFKNIAAAQAYRSFAEEIASSRLIKVLADVFTGNEWDNAKKYFEQYSGEAEDKIVNLIGEPEFLNSIIEQSLQRQAMYKGSTTISTSATLLLFDVSGSMTEEDATGMVKIDSAKAAGDRILDIVDSENYATCTSSAQLGIASFANSATLNQVLSTDTSLARSALGGLYAGGGTGMPDGLSLAIDQFQNTSNGKPILIMLSDGMPNIGLGGAGWLDEASVRQQVLDLASQAKQKSICIYTVGFGIPGAIGSMSGDASIDEDFLKQISANAGCGVYYNAQNATELANVYVGLRHESTGNVLLQKTGNISQGQTVDLGSAAVPQGQSEILFTLNWPGSRLDPGLIDPASVTVDQNYPGASFYQSNSLASIIIQNPKAGTWKFSAIGVDVPEGMTTYNAILSTRPNPAAPQGQPVTGALPVVIILLLLAGAGIFAYVTTRRRRVLVTATGTQAGRGVTRAARMPAAGGPARLNVISGPLARRTFPLTNNLLIGRGSACQLHLPDPSVSRQHARLRYARGHWYIQDTGSRAGVEVNGVRVRATILKNGDTVRIGITEFEFRE